MTSFYFPAFWVGVYYFCFSGDAKGVSILLMLHFGKRTLECLFLHQYSGTQPLASCVVIAASYVLQAVMVARSTAKREDKAFNRTLATIGVILFVIGQLGNFYHHYLLACLRKPGDKTYKVPQGGLFEYVASPHYFFELIAWWGLVLVCQHDLLVGTVLVMSVYLTDRAVAQSDWNRKNLKEKYPEHRKHIVPFVF
jgi:steroid 5-alpha reductase family enzyme